MQTLVIHGGAGNIKPEDRDSYLSGLQKALRLGYEKLEAGSDALTAAIAAVVAMEDNPLAFNAGTGGSPNRMGEVECDAAVAAGWNRSSGAVAGVRVAKNPILLADKVRRDTPHVFIVGAGADALVENPIPNSDLLTERTRAHLAKWLEKNQEPTGSATVGAVALDNAGRLAAATSTGGVLGKWQGRVGDAPLIGSGTYADARVAISGTGKGEAFIRAVAAKEISCRLRLGEPLENAVGAVLEDILSLDGSGGFITITADGTLCFGYNTPNMAYAYKNAREEEAAVGDAPGVYRIEP